MGTAAFMPSLQQLQQAQTLQQQVFDQKSNGRAMKALNLKKRAKVQAFAATKEIKSATIINFNPVDLKLSGGLPYSVPAVSRQVEAMRLKVKWGRNLFVGAYMTIHEPYYYPRITDVKLPDSTADMADGAAEYDMEACRPIESAWHLWASVNANAQDASDMGGVVILEGDHHRFTKAIEAAAKDVDHPDSFINIPRFVTLEDQNRQYYVEPVSIIDVIAEATQKQIDYFEFRMQLAQSMHDDPDQRKNITTVDRIWAQYGMTMGWRQTAPVFLNAQEDPTDTCVGCGSLRTRSDALFCGKCNRPYDAYVAFMAGENVPDVYLVSLPEDKLKEVRKEMRRRKNALDLSIDDDDDPTPGGGAPAPATAPVAPAASATVNVPHQEQASVGGGVQTPAEHSLEKLEAKTKPELLKIAKELGLDFHHNVGAEKIITGIREARQKMLTDDDDDLVSMN